MIEVKVFCDWCNGEVEREEVLRDVHFMIIQNRVCNICLKKVKKLKKEIMRDSEERGKDGNL